MNTITTWRAVIDQLTPAQIAGYQRAEAQLDTRQPEDLVAQALLAQQARDDAEANRIDRERFGHIPAPVGADRTWHWTLDPQTGRWSRAWAGPTQHVGGIVVGVEGIQHTDATVTSQVILTGDGAALTANQARHLAAALLQAAEETDRYHQHRGGMTMTNTTYGTWHQAVGGSSLTLHGTVEGALDGYPGIDVDAVAGAYRDAINAALPDWVQLCGDEFYGAADAERPDIKAIIDGIDFWAIVERHDKS